MASAGLASPCAHTALQPRARLDFFTTPNSLPNLLPNSLPNSLLFSLPPTSSLAHPYTCLLPFSLSSFFTPSLTHFPTARPPARTLTCCRHLHRYSWLFSVLVALLNWFSRDCCVVGLVPRHFISSHNLPTPCAADDDNDDSYTWPFSVQVALLDSCSCHRCNMGLVSLPLHST